MSKPLSRRRPADAPLDSESLLPFLLNAVQHVKDITKYSGIRYCVVFVSVHDVARRRGSCDHIGIVSTGSSLEKATSND